MSRTNFTFSSRILSDPPKIIINSDISTQAVLGSTRQPVTYKTEHERDAARLRVVANAARKKRGLPRLAWDEPTPPPFRKMTDAQRRQRRSECQKGTQRRKAATHCTCGLTFFTTQRTQHVRSDRHLHRMMDQAASVGERQALDALRAGYRDTQASKMREYRKIKKEC